MINKIIAALYKQQVTSNAVSLALVLYYTQTTECIEKKVSYAQLEKRMRLNGKQHIKAAAAVLEQAGILQTLSVPSQQHTALLTRYRAHDTTGASQGLKTPFKWTYHDMPATAVDTPWADAITTIADMVRSMRYKPREMHVLLLLACMANRDGVITQKNLNRFIGKKTNQNDRTVDYMIKRFCADDKTPLQKNDGVLSFIVKEEKQDEIDIFDPKALANDAINDIINMGLWDNLELQIQWDQEHGLLDNTDVYALQDKYLTATKIAYKQLISQGMIHAQAKKHVAEAQYRILEKCRRGDIIKNYGGLLQTVSKKMLADTKIMFQD